MIDLKKHEGQYDALAFKGEFSMELYTVFRPLEGDAKEAADRQFGRTKFGLCIVRTPENLQYRGNMHLQGLRFFWRGYALSPEFQPFMFDWVRIADDLYGGVLKDESLRTRNTLPSGDETLVPR